MTFKITAAKSPNLVIRKNSPKKIVKQPKKLFPRLSDPDKQEELMEMYGSIIEDSNQWQDYVAYIQNFLTAHFSSESFFTTSHPVVHFPEGKEEPNEAFFEQWNNTYEDLCSKGYLNSLNVTQDSVTFYIPRLLVPVRFDYGTIIPDEHMEGITNTFKTLFKEFKFPTVIQSDTKESGRAYMVVPEKYTTGFVDVNDIIGLQFEDPVRDGSYKPENDIDYEPNKNVLDCLSVRITLDTIYTPSSVLGDEQRTVVARVPDAVGYTNLFVDARVTIPMEMALWLTHCTKAEEFIPSLFHGHICKIARDEGAEHEEEMRTMSLETTININKQVQKDFGYTPKRRVNKDGFTIVSSGNILYVPDKVSPEDYSDKLRACYDPETGKITPEKDVKELAAIPVNVDWMNDVFSYTTQTGSLIHQRIRGSIPLDDITIGRYLHHSIESPFGSDDPNSHEFMVNGNTLKDLFIKTGSEALRQLDLAERYNEENDAIYKYFVLLWETISNTFRGHALFNVFDASNRKRLIEEHGIVVNPKMDDYINAFIGYCRTISDNILNISGQAVSSLCLSKFTFHLIGYYTADSVKYMRAFHDNRIKNSENIPAKDKFELPSLPGLKSLMYHQADIATKTELLPTFLTADVQPGGGKTCSATVAFVQYLNKHPDKKVGVIVPDILVKEWYSFVTNSSQNQINCIGLTAKTVEKMISHLEIDRKGFLDYIHKLPTNSVIIIGMNMTTLKRDLFDSSKKLPYVQYGDSFLHVLPNTLLVRQFGLDKIFIDESQRAKNVEAQVSSSIKQIRSEANDGGGILSGTLVGNLGSDLVNQFGLEHPLILGNHEQFEQRYGIIDDGGRFLGFKRDAHVILRQDASPYTRWVQKTRSDWAYVLPKILGQYYQVKLTPNQQKWNNMLIDEAVQEIMNDPKIKKLLNSSDDDEDAQNKLENAIKAHLARVEIFINAPDARPRPTKGKAALFFADTSGVEQEDLVSPKLPYIQRIVYHHFHGGQFIAPDGTKMMLDGRPVIFKKQTSKIIIFCYHTEVTEHVFRHLKVPGINILKYQAGDEEVITRFKEDPRYQVLVASENSLREGLNLQVASRVIRVETLWTEGAEEQAISRVMRPDVADKYARTEINVDVLLTVNTMEMAKRARLISKIVMNARVKNFDENFHRWMDRHNIDQLPILRMNLKAIRNLNNTRDLAPYYNAQAVINDWEDRQFDEKRNRLKQLTAQKLGIPLEEVTPAMVKDFAMKPVVYAGRLPNSNQVWTPVPNGATPYDPRNLGLKPLSIIVEDDENEEENGGDESELHTVAVGDIVWTEYGFGKITKTNKKSVGVNVPVLGTVNLSKQVVFLPTHEENIKKLKKEIKATGGISFLQSGDPATAQNVKMSKKEAPKLDLSKAPKPPKTAPVNDEPVKINKDKIDQIVDKSIELHVYGAVLNGNACVIVYDEDEDGSQFKAVMKNMPEVKWRVMPPFASWHIKKARAVAPVLEMLNENFSVPSAVLKQFENLGQQLYRKGMQNLKQHTDLEWGTKDGETLNYNFSNFYRLNHTKSKLDNGLKIYPVVEDGELYLCAMIDIQRPQITKLKRLMTRLKSYGVGDYDETSTTLIHNSKTMNEAINIIRIMRKRFTVEGGNEAISTLKASRRLIMASKPDTKK